MFDSERILYPTGVGIGKYLLGTFFEKSSLDNPKCYKRLERLVEGFQIAPPMAFILCGDYLDNPHSPDAFQILKEVCHFYTLSGLKSGLVVVVSFSVSPDM